MKATHAPLGALVAVIAPGLAGAWSSTVAKPGAVGLRASSLSRGQKTPPSQVTMKGGARERSGRFGFGRFAGYVWRHKLHSIEASWTVPGIRRGASVGYADTWIGAQAENLSSFIQLGSIERGAWRSDWRHPAASYFAFWSDRQLEFRPQVLLGLNVGDRVSASMTLADGRWTLKLVDHSSRASKTISSGQEADAVPNQAEWFQENPTNSSTEGTLPYADLTRVRLHCISVNDKTPAYGQVLSSWMSAARTYWAPGPLRHGSFAIRRAQLSAVGARYLQNAAVTDRADAAFAPQMDAWRSATPLAEIEAARAKFAASLRETLQVLTRARWPASARKLLGAVLAAHRTLLHQVESPPRDSEAGLSAWRDSVEHDVARLQVAARRARRALGVPQLVTMR